LTVLRAPAIALPRLLSIEFARSEFFDGAREMGAKYLPTVKDQKAGQRFHQKQHVQSKFIKPAGRPAAAKRKKK
jgi:hypothetical protein